MNWFLGIAFVLVVLFLIHNYRKKVWFKKVKDALLKNWGKSKEKKYFNFYAIKKYFENNLHKKEAYFEISEQTNADLDIDELFKYIDRTTSKIGQQYLYCKLRTIGTIEKLKKFDGLSNLFFKNKELRVKSQLLLLKLNSQNAYDLEKLINEEPVKKSKYLKLIYGLSASSVLLVILSFFNPIFSIFLPFIFFINLVIHYKNKDNVTYYMSAVSQLSKALNVGEKLNSFNEIKSHFSDTSFLKKVKSIKTKTEFIAFDNYLTNEYAALFWLIVEIIKIQFLVEYIFFFSFVDSIEKEKESVDKLFQFIGEIDSAISVASLKTENKTLCNPNFVTNKQVEVEGITHPLVKNCVANSLAITNKSLLLTGSNMSGKTTFIRTIAINAILGQTLYVCFAKAYTAPFFKVYSSIRITDDLMENTSYYLEEVLTIKKLIEVSENKEPCLFVLDEIFKGTNTVERVSGGKAILSYLNSKNHVVFVSTHDIELTSLLEKENYELYHFSESINDEKLHFDHTLKAGRLKTRNAIKILELYGYPSKIIKDARKLGDDI